MQRDFRPAGLYVTENGTSGPDGPGADGAIHDLYRTRYLARHTAAVHQAIADGANVQGYFAWPFVDNDEWAPHGEGLRGLVRAGGGRQRLSAGRCQHDAVSG